MFKHEYTISHNIQVNIYSIEYHKNQIDGYNLTLSVRLATSFGVVLSTLRALSTPAVPADSTRIATN